MTYLSLTFLINVCTNLVNSVFSCTNNTHTLISGLVLENMGAGNLFQASANLSVLTNNTDQQLSLGNALHKAKIEVSEEGTKAAAATILFSFRSSRPIEPTQFHCNHPFIYLIYDKVQDAILFTGVFRRPH